MADNNGDSVASFLLGFIFGGLIGAVSALLLAPRSGEETRMLIREKSIELQDTATTKAGDLAKMSQEKMSELQKKGQLVLEEQKARIPDVKIQVPDESVEIDKDQVES
jgi:gas vesicle protein